MRRLAAGWRSRTAWVLIAMSCALVVYLPLSVAALDVPAKPSDLPVVDQTGTLSQEQRQSLAAKIAAERSQSGNEIAILMVRSLEGEAIEDYSLKVARGWGVGQRDRDSGVLLLVAKDDRRLRIEVGYGLEGALPDIRANQIIEQRITPQFREGKYYEGIDSGVDGIIAAIKGERDPNLQSSGQGDTNFWRNIPFEIIFWGIILVPVWLSSILGRTKSWWAGGVIGGAAGVAIGIFFGFLFFGVAAIVGLTLLGLLFDKKVSDNYRRAASSKSDTPSWWAGGPWLGGGGRGGGGGFGGFSGGSFGGGGSSGSW